MYFKKYTMQAELKLIICAALKYLQVIFSFLEKVFVLKK